MRLVGPEGEMHGVVVRAEALRIAEESGLDLVEVSPNAVPPVCKVLDYGKHKYETQKKAAAARKNQKTIEVKEVQLRPAIEENDYQVKMKRARKFIESGNKVKVTLRFRGREMAHQDIGMALLKRFQDDLQDIGKVDHAPTREGRQMLMVLSPL